jgi:hypothetical protein
MGQNPLVDQSVIDLTTRRMSLSSSTLIDTKNSEKLTRKINFFSKSIKGGNGSFYGKRGKSLPQLPRKMEKAKGTR